MIVWMLGCTGAFRVEMSKDESRDRAIRCRYNPTEVGSYVLHIQWSGTHVPGSPFTVPIVDTRRELDMVSGQVTASAHAFDHQPLILDGGSSDFDGSGSLRMSTFSGDGLFFNDDA